MYNTAWFSQPQRRRVHLFPTLHLVFPSWPRACHPLPGRRNSVFPGFWFLSSFLRFERFLGRGVAVLLLPASSHSRVSRGPSEVLWIETAGHSRPPLPHLGGSVLFLAPLGILASRRPIAAFRWCVVCIYQLCRGGFGVREAARERIAMQDSRVLTLDGLLASTSIVGTEVVRAYLQAQDLLE
jgi:hypothetical protein